MVEPNRRSANHSSDPDNSLGGLAQDRPGQPNNVAPLSAQIDHRDQRPIKKGEDTDFPEPGSNPEYSMQKQDSNNEPRQDERPLHPANDPDGNAEANLNDQEPGASQKRNQGDKK